MSNRTFAVSCSLPGSAICTRAYTSVKLMFFTEGVLSGIVSKHCTSIVRQTLCGKVVDKVRLSKGEFFCMGPLRARPKIDKGLCKCGRILPRHPN